MKFPKKTKPVDRHVVAPAQMVNGIAPSSSCGCPNACIGPCVFGNCVGVCV